MLEPGFATSKPFIVGAIVAVLIVGVGAASYTTANDQGWFGGTSNCDPIRVPGGTPGIIAADQREPERREIEITVPRAPQGGAVELCIAVGEIVVTRAPGDVPELTLTIRGPSGAVDSTVVETLTSTENGRLRLAVWESQQGRQGTLGNTRSATVALELSLPDGLWDLHAYTHVGEVHVSDVRVGTLRLSSEVGNVVATQLNSEGNTTVTTSVGSITLDYESVQSSRIRATSNVDGVEIRLPERADVGYKVHAWANVGDVDIDIGPTENLVNDRDATGAEVNAQSRGYDNKPTQVEIEATADVGDVLVKSP